MIRALVVVALLAGTAVADAPPIDTAIADAAASRKLLVVEIGATWCRPCREFERTVLTDAAVIAELRAVAFVRYDVDTPIGDEAARRYNVHIYPTFLVLDAHGVEASRTEGLPEPSSRWFLQLLHGGTSATSPIDKLRATIAAHPDDLVARITLARLLRDSGVVAEALEMFRSIRDADGVDPILGAEADAAVQDIEAGERRVQSALDEARVFVEQHPASPIASRRLALLVFARRFEREELERTLVAHLAAVHPIDRPNAIRVALLAGQPLIARAALAGWTDGDPVQAQLIRAELALDAGNRDEALRIVRTACATPTGVEAWCLDLQGALRSAQRGVPGVSRLRIGAQAQLENLRRPERTFDSLARLDPGVANAVARGVLAAEKSCTHLAGRTPRVFFAIELATAGGPPRYVAIEPSDNADLVRCLRASLAQVAFPALRATDDPRVYTTLVFASAQEHTTTPPSSRMPSGVVLGVVSRTGDLETNGVAIDGTIDLASVTQLRLMATGHAEAGFAESGHAAYAGRVLVGFGCTTVLGPTISATAGIGASRFGDSVPAGWETPFELHLRVPLRRTVAHAWAGGAFVHGEPSRGGSRALFGADETAFGIGAVLPAFFPREIFVAAVYEQRAIGNAALLWVGIPLGTF